MRIRAPNAEAGTSVLNARRQTETNGDGSARELAAAAAGAEHGHRICAYVSLCSCLPLVCVCVLQGLVWCSVAACADLLWCVELPSEIPSRPGRHKNERPPPPIRTHTHSSHNDLCCSFPKRRADPPACRRYTAQEQ